MTKSTGSMKRKISDRQRMNFLQGNAQTKVAGGLWVYFSEDCPDSGNIRKAIDAAIRASRRQP
jgi:hypothetical protein